LDSQLVQTAKEFKTLVVVTDRASTEKCRSLQDCGVEVMKLAANESGHPDITLLLDELGRREMNNLLVEGGGSVLGSFFDRDAIDEVHVFIAPKLVGGATASSPMAGFGRELMKQAAALSDVEYEILGSDVYVHGFVATDETMANG
ncbi:MAG: riboflavin biosynthesis protein RibD, partial [Planctomycetes bacterium]|nr:riboflavin biosynthesis protein RibD [Planctomycetota bacterium]